MQYYEFLKLGRGHNKTDWIIPYIKGKNVLHIGCTGHNTYPCEEEENWLHGIVAREAGDCVGLDINKELINNLNKMNYKCIYGDAQNFSLDKKYDVILAPDVIEHLHDYKGFFTCIRTHLVDDGILLITTPQPWFFLRFLRCLIKGDAGFHQEHTLWFCRHTLEEMLHRYKFTIVHIEYGSQESIFYKLFFLIKILRHTSIFLAARVDNSVYDND